MTLYALWRALYLAAVLLPLGAPPRSTLRALVALWALLTAALLAVRYAALTPSLEESWRLVNAASLAAALAASVVWLLRAARREWTPAEVVSLLLTVSAIGDMVAGPWLRASPIAVWPIAALPSIATSGAVALYHLGALWIPHYKRC